MEKVIINDHIRGEPLAEENIDDVLDLVNKIRLSSAQKSIWLYTGFTWEEVFSKIYTKDHIVTMTTEKHQIYRQHIIKQCNVLIDGQYIESQREISLPYRGSSNQRLIDIQQSLQEGEIVLCQT